MLNLFHRGFGDGRWKVEADSIEVGFGGSLLYQGSERTRWGLTYSSEINPSRDADNELTGLGPNTEAAMRRLGILGQGSHHREHVAAIHAGGCVPRVRKLRRRDGRPGLARFQQFPSLGVLSTTACPSRAMTAVTTTSTRSAPATAGRYRARDLDGVGWQRGRDGRMLAARLAELAPMTPLGMDLDFIFFQGEVVTEAIDNFIVSLAQAVAIVIVVLLVFMGLRSGLIIGVVLLVTILGTLIVMSALGITLQRISARRPDHRAGNAGGQCDRDHRRDPGQDFARHGSNPGSRGDHPADDHAVAGCHVDSGAGLRADRLFPRQHRGVHALAVPGDADFAAVQLDHDPDADAAAVPPVPEAGESLAGGENAFYRGYRTFLVACIRFRYLTLGATLGLLVLAIIGFGMLRDGFFPPSTQPQFMVNYWLPQGDISQHIGGHARDRAVPVVA